MEDSQACDQQFGLLAPVITEAAEQGSSAAVRVCGKAVHQIKVGIELLASSFSGDQVNVAFIGGVATSPYMYNTLCDALKRGNNKQFSLVKPQLPPVAGAILYAMNRLNLPLSDEIISNLRHQISLA
jgi:glucosamine kinase